MKKQVLSLLVVCLGVLMFGTVVFAGEVVWEDIGDGYRNIRAILIDYKKPQNLYFGSDQGVFSSTGQALRQYFFKAVYTESCI